MKKWRFWIDTGGTFTDCLAESPEGERLRAKVLSNSALRGTVAQRLGDRALRLNVATPVVDDFYRGYRFEIEVGDRTLDFKVEAWNADNGTVGVDSDIPGAVEGRLCSFLSPEEPPLLAARVLTRRRLDESLPPLEMRLATTRGTNALLEQKVARCALVVTKGFRDLLRIGNQQRPELFSLGIQKPDPLYSGVFELDERVDADGRVDKALDEAELSSLVEWLKANEFESVAVALLHSYLNSEHEAKVAERLNEAGIDRISLSSELSPLIKIVPRAETAVVDASLSPLMESYLDSVETPLENEALRVMTSSGGLAGRATFRSKDGLLSGPAGGVVGASGVALRAGFRKSIAFDMGGTSADVSRFDGQLPYQYEQVVGGARIYAPSLQIETVAAGGGSICWFDGSALRVGPESAGASPGPACYGAGGPLTLTDVNLLLGRIDQSRFGIPVDVEASRERFAELRERIAESGEAEARAERALLQGWLDIANERMAEAIRKISLREGYDPAEYVLVAFGGAGGLHACAIADILEMNTVLFPSDAGLLSAYGLSQAKLERFEERQVLEELGSCQERIADWKRELYQSARSFLKRDGAEEAGIRDGSAWVEMRYVGQESAIAIEDGEEEPLQERFERAFFDQYGFTPRQPIEVVALRVCAYVAEERHEEERFPEKAEPRGASSSGAVWKDEIDGRFALSGPVAVQDPFSAVYIADGWETVLGDRGSLLLRRAGKRRKESIEKMDTVELELFTNRFLSLVEEMGELLERSAFSTNVKERRDFSCALLDAEGWLVANAPHIPVHLGALGVCVRESVAVQPLGEGDILIVNHPGFGGSHLPDITLIAGVFDDKGQRIGYVANRAHHAEIGGIAPGSMPPNAKSLEEEGVVIPPTLLASEGRIDWEGIERLLSGARYPTRRLQENLSDLAAQVASIRLGTGSLRELARVEGTERVAYFLQALRRRSAEALRRALECRALERSRADERLDGGARIQAEVFAEGDRWVIDFNGSAAQQKSNYNATRGIATSATIYVLRLLAGEDLPLNEGFLDVVDIRIPDGILNPDFSGRPDECPPVVAGNVEVSQRIVDTLIKAFALAACSQGTMNNLIFGNDRISYYETIAGGEGATPNRPGASGTHTHMTNTAITDPEILEKRFPVRLESFALRLGSGGRGTHCGGDGVVRRIRFLEPVTVSLLSQHRVEVPFGMEGGQAGAPGEQVLFRNDGSSEDLEGNASVEIAAGEALEIRAPGGGGWGSP